MCHELAAPVEPSAGSEYGPGVPAPEPLARLLDRWLEKRPPRARSLVVSVFGDAVVPHGEVVWIGTLIRWLEPFGVNGRTVRTAVQRLVRDGWLAPRAAGRRTDYTLTETSRHRFADAERRIYASEPATWNGTWSLVLLGSAGLSAPERDAVRRELRWHGFGELYPGVLLHPGADLKELALDLGELGVERRVVVLSGRTESAFPGHAPEAVRALAASAWDLRDLAAEYTAFVRRFRDLLRKIDETGAPSPQTCFRARVLVIHEFRRILLQDPRLPPELLPKDWVGAEARWLCEAIYRRVEKEAVAFILETGETARGRLEPPAAAYAARFGGLDRPAPVRAPRRATSRP